MQLASHEFAKRQLKGSQQSNNLASHYSPEILPFKINHDQSMPCRRDVAEITAKLLKLGSGAVLCARIGAGVARAAAASVPDSKRSRRMRVMACSPTANRRNDKRPTAPSH